MKQLKTIERMINCPEEILFGIRLGENRGDSTITEVYIKSESLEEQEVNFRILGSIEREGLVHIFKTLSEILEKEIKTN